MKFSTREDINAPVEKVFRAVTDFERFERQFQKRGVEVERIAANNSTEAGNRWHACFNWRGRPHEVETELVSLDPNQGLALRSQSKGVVCLSIVDLVALSKQHTRLFVSLDLKPTTLASRLLVQSLRIAKPRLSKKFKARVSDLANEISR